MGVNELTAVRKTTITEYLSYLDGKQIMILVAQNLIKLRIISHLLIQMVEIQ